MGSYSRGLSVDPPSASRLAPSELPPSKITGTLRGSVTASIAGKSVEMATLVLLATLVPRALGPEDYGRFALPLTIVTVVSLGLTLGGPTLMTRFVPAAPPEERVALARRLGARLARGRALQLGVIVALAAVLAIADGERFPPVLTTIVVAALVLNVAATLMLQVVLGLGRTAPWSARYPLQNAVLVALVLVLHPIGGATAAVAAILAAAVVAVAFAVASTAPVIVRRDRSAADVPPGALRFGQLQAAGAALMQITHRGGVIAVAVLAASSVELGFTALAIGLSLGATYAILQIFTVSLPFLELGGDHLPAEAALRRVAGAMLVILVPSALVASLTVDLWVPRLFGDEYRGATTALVVAVAIVVLAPLGALTVQAAAIRLRPEAALVAGLVAAGSFVLVGLALVPSWGASGATAAALAGVTAGSLASIRMLPGAVGARIALASFAGAAGVLLAAAT